MSDPSQIQNLNIWDKIKDHPFASTLNNAVSNPTTTVPVTPAVPTKTAVDTAPATPTKTEDKQTVAPVNE